jgi:hypothetical protein
LRQKSTERWTRGSALAFRGQVEIEAAIARTRRTSAEYEEKDADTGISSRNLMP